MTMGNRYKLFIPFLNSDYKSQNTEIHTKVFCYSYICEERIKMEVPYESKSYYPDAVSIGIFCM